MDRVTRLPSVDRPIFHVMPRSGWLNDPNGPIYHKGRYHIFYQHVVDSTTWDWGLVWGHASSKDLVRWEHEPIAISPTVGAHDADGCWSGNVAIETDGSPVLLYTAVRLREKESSIALPSEEHDLGLEQIECQCVAHCDPGDTGLTVWEKQQEPVVEHPPTGLGKLTGFRDPFVFSRKSEQAPWKIIVGSGIEGESGTILQYHTDWLSNAWEFKGPLVKGKSKPCQDGADFDLGRMWECPFFVNLPQFDDRSVKSDTWMLCVSPYPHFREDRPTNPCLYWLGSFNHEVFNLDDVAGPKLLDLGDILYAPTIFAGSDNCMMVGWLQELQRKDPYDHAGCLTVPRLLSLQDGRLRQDPATELTGLRTGLSKKHSDVLLRPGELAAVFSLQSDALDITIQFERQQSSAVGILLRASHHDSSSSNGAEALVLTWEEPRLQVTAIANVDTSALKLDGKTVGKEIGGPIHLPPEQQSIQLRIFLDHSVVEVFTEHGQTLTTRAYRSKSASERPGSLYLFSMGGEALAKEVQVHQLQSVWGEESELN